MVTEERMEKGNETEVRGEEAESEGKIEDIYLGKGRS